MAHVYQQSQLKKATNVSIGHPTKIGLKYYDYNISFKMLHTILKCGTPRSSNALQACPPFTQTVQ